MLVLGGETERQGMAGGWRTGGAAIHLVPSHSPVDALAWVLEVELDDLVDESRVAGHDDRPSNVTDRKKPRSSVRKTHRGERPFDERTYHLVLLVPMQVT